MKQLSLSHQKLLKTIHLIFAGLWLSSVILLTLLPFVPQKPAGGDEVYMHTYIYHFIDMFVLTPAAVITLLSGLIYSLFTKWGFFRHGWLVYKWIITLAMVLVGTFYLGPMVGKLLEIADVKRSAAATDPYFLHGAVIGVWAGVINSSLLILAVFVSVYKPWKNIRS